MAQNRYSGFETKVLYEYEQMLKRTYPEKNKSSKPIKAKRKKERYLRNESSYNAHQENEFIFFIATLPFIVFNSLINSGLKLNKLNFQRYLIAHICLGIKDYFGLSLRRTVGLIKFIFWAMKWRCTIPCFKTLNNYMIKRECSVIQENILEFSISPLVYLETHFNIDSTHETLSTSSSWYDYRIGKKKEKKDHLKEHITSTAKYNAVAALDISQEGDAKFIRSHIEKIKKQGFRVKDMSGDKGYLSRDGCNAVKEAGGNAHFKIKSNTISNAKGSKEWKRMVTAQQNKDTEEIDKYNIRQNAESTNHAKKSKFGSTLRSKIDATKEAEARGKWCAYNITAICRAYYDNAIDFDYIQSNLHIERMLTYT